MTTDVPNMVDMERLGTDIGGNAPPPEVAKFAPAKFRTQTSLSQMLNELKRQLSDAQRTLDDLQRLIG